MKPEEKNRSVKISEHSFVILTILFIIKKKRKKVNTVGS